jgi:hypothetical protein
MTSTSKLSPQLWRQRSSSKHTNFLTTLFKLHPQLLSLSLLSSSTTTRYNLHHKIKPNLLTTHTTTMPIPTPDFQSQENQVQPNSAGAICSTGQADLSSFAALDGSAPHLESGASRDNNALQDDRGDRPLSKEEADRLYEERMEDEYAKREGGA